MLKRILDTLLRHHFSFQGEAQLQEGIAQVLTCAGIAFEREFILGPKDRLDFFVDGSIAIEVKIKGSAPDLTRQLSRYAQDERIKAVVVVTSRYQLTRHPKDLHGVPIHVVYLSGLV